MREALVDELRTRAGLTDEQARRAAEVFERFLRERATGSGREDFQGLFTGSIPLFEEQD